MTFATLGSFRLFLASVIVTILVTVDKTAVSGALLELLFMGRIPGTDVIISFEAFFAGMVFFAWAIATYNFTITAIVKIGDLLKETTLSTNEIEEIAL